MWPAIAFTSHPGHAVGRLHSSTVNSRRTAKTRSYSVVASSSATCRGSAETRAVLGVMLVVVAPFMNVILLISSCSQPRAGDPDLVGVHVDGALQQPPPPA